MLEKEKFKERRKSLRDSRDKSKEKLKDREKRKEREREKEKEREREREREANRDRRKLSYRVEKVFTRIPLFSPPSSYLFYSLPSPSFSFPFSLIIGVGPKEDRRIAGGHPARTREDRKCARAQYGN